MGAVSQVAAVTGGSAGIGRVICEALLASGYDVVSLARRRGPLEHPRLHQLEVDLTDRQATAQAAQELQRRAVTTLVHNAGVIRPALLPEVQLDDLDALMALHLGSAIQLLQATLPAMRAARFGRVVLMGSRAALGAQTRTAYSATKAGIIGMGRTWALELAPHGITVNMVAPGPIQGTHMFHEIVPAGSERETALANAIPVKRLGKPEDVANAVLFFASAESSFVTGQVLYVCGGASVGTLTI